MAMQITLIFYYLLSINLSSILSISSLSYLLYYFLSSIILSLIHLSLIHSYLSLIHPASIRHRPRQAEYRHAAALRAQRASTAAA
jgi:cellulose synthase/poly-beta-1,6-N-acetylglucosamine synthase-like glycosyltransferase